MIPRFSHRDDLEPATKIQLQVGKTVSGVEYMAANRMRGWAMDYIKKLFADQIDVFLTPGCPIVAPQIPKGALPHGESNLPLFTTVMRYIFLTNLAGKFTQEEKIIKRETGCGSCIVSNFL